MSDNEHPANVASLALFAFFGDIDCRPLRSAHILVFIAVVLILWPLSHLSGSFLFSPSLLTQETYGESLVNRIISS